MNKKFSIRELFSLSWVDFKKHWKIAILAMTPIAVIDIIDWIFGASEDGYYNEQFEWISTGMEGSLIVTIITFFASIFILIGLTKIYLNIADGKDVKFGQNFNGVDSIKHYGMFFITYIATALAMLLPIIIVALISTPFVYEIIDSDVQNITVPIALGITIPVLFVVLFAIVLYLTMALQFAYYFSIENRYHFITALKKSWAMTKGLRGKLFLLTLSVILLNILGVLALLVGLLITIPMTTIIYSHLYRKLDPEVSSRETPSTEKVEIKIENKSDESKEK